MKKIVIVEDELIAAEYLKEILEQNGFEVLAVISSGKEAKQRIPELSPDIVLMDIILKDAVSGSEVALYLKHIAEHIAIVFLTANVDDEMTEYALKANTFGYLMKPYNESEIINTLKVIALRLQDLLGREKEQNRAICLDENFTYDLQYKKLLKDGVEMKLGKNAKRLIELLCKNINAIVSNEQIVHYVWQEEKSDVTIRTQIHRIKEKLGVNFIQNISGSGYMIASKK